MSSAWLVATKDESAHKNCMLRAIDDIEYRGLGLCAIRMNLECVIVGGWWLAESGNGIDGPGVAVDG